MKKIFKFLCIFMIFLTVTFTLNARTRTFSQYSNWDNNKTIAMSKTLFQKDPPHE